MDIRPEVFTADYTGRPGERTFFLQSRSETLTLTYQLEKGQVEVLGEKLKELLLMIDPNDAIRSSTPSRDPAYSLTAPIEPEWRVGTMGLTYDDATDSVVIALEPAADAEAEIEDDAGPDVDEFAVRILLRPDQARAFILHALAIVGEGRPLCQLCGLPMDPDGHKCPASNGHRLS